MSKYKTKNKSGLSCNPSVESTEQPDLHLKTEMINSKPVIEDPKARTGLNPGDPCRPKNLATGDGNPPHYWISAVTIYCCLDTRFSFNDWISSLYSILEAAESNTPYRLRREEDDVYSLNLEFAASFNKDISRDFCGAITMSVIDDILFDSPKPMPDWQIRSLIEGLESLIRGGSVSLGLLHELLDIELEDGGYWFLQLVDAFGMVNLRDVQMWDEEGEIYAGKDFPENFRDYECAFSMGLPPRSRWPRQPKGARNSTNTSRMPSAPIRQKVSEY